MLFGTAVIGLLKGFHHSLARPQSAARNVLYTQQTWRHVQTGRGFSEVLSFWISKSGVSKAWVKSEVGSPTAFLFESADAMQKRTRWNESAEQSEECYCQPICFMKSLQRALHSLRVKLLPASNLDPFRSCSVATCTQTRSCAMETTVLIASGVNTSS